MNKKIKETKLCFMLPFGFYLITCTRKVSYVIFVVNFLIIAHFKS